jgi:transcriptional regulator with XRE-family HTH domain
VPHLLSPEGFFLYIFSRNEGGLMLPTDPDSPAIAPSEAIVLTKAVLRAADQLGMTYKTLATVIGVSEATVSRMRSGEYELQRGQKAFELGVLFVRFYRSLDAILGGDTTVASAWLRNKNTALDASPLAMIQTVSGLVNVIQYLDARRAVV